MLNNLGLNHYEDVYRLNEDLTGEKQLQRKNNDDWKTLCNLNNLVFVYYIFLNVNKHKLLSLLLSRKIFHFIFPLFFTVKKIT
jgi:hypothetical protein